jgi:uncharacterized protein (TIGR03790 family)
VTKFFRHPLLLLLSFLLLPCDSLAQTDDLAQRVVIVVNARDADSLRIGRHYAERRGIPEANILKIDAPATETISRQEYIDTIHNPLQSKLLETGWLQGIPSTLKDRDGRFRSIIEGHRISYLVLCRGVPLRISNDPDSITPEMERSLQKEFLTNQASVDSELALLPVAAPWIGFVVNPLFGNASPAPLDLQRILKVSRLDGPTAAAAMALVDGAIEAEQRGLRGRAYVDTAGPHPNGVEWLRATAKQIRDQGFDLDLREAPGIFPVENRFDAPALYFGWYANDLAGPFELSGFGFPPGAIAFHIHSFSARTVRSGTAGWCGPLVERGAAVTLGNVFEPYLELSHQPQLFLESLLKGNTVGDAAAYSIRVYSWQNVVIGDPLYRPFLVPLDEQLERVRVGEGGALGSYAVIRRVNQLAARNQREEAITLARQSMERHPSLALALKLAQLQNEARDRRQAINTLRVFSHLRQVPLMEVMVAKEAADLLSVLNEQSQALAVYEVLLATPGLPPAVQRSLLESGVILADRLGQNQRTREWRSQLAQLQN